MAIDLELITEIKKQLPRETRLPVQKRFQAAFQKTKNKMIIDFLNHPVTLELKGGISASNISGTLGGATNLFSFIGFDSSYDPIQPIENMLNQTNYKFIKITSKSVEFLIDIPEPKEIFSATPMPWATGRSWAKGIESGISGLGYYLKVSRDGSRSGLGIQSSKKVRAGGVRFKNTQYISALIKQYKKEFQNLKSI